METPKVVMKVVVIAPGIEVAFDSTGRLDVIQWELLQLALKAVQPRTLVVLRLVSAGDRKIMVIKLIREITGLGLKESKDLVEALPAVVKQFDSSEDAISVAKRFAEIGATAEVLPCV